MPPAILTALLLSLSVDRAEPADRSVVRWVEPGDTPAASPPVPEPVVISARGELRRADHSARPAPTRAEPVINLDLRGADLRGVLHLLAAAGDFDFAMPDHITATVDVQLHDVPCSLALHTILRLEGLRAHTGAGGILIISSADKPGEGG